MKLLILLLNTLPIFTLGNNIYTYGSFFPSPKEQKFFKYYLTSSGNIYGYGEIDFLQGIPIVPYTSISLISLDTNLLSEKKSELVELDEFLSNKCSEIDWENYNLQFNPSPRMKSKLSNQYKLAKLFTAGSSLGCFGLDLEKLMCDLGPENIALNKLKEQLEIYFPKSSIKAYDVEFSDSDYSFNLIGHINRDSAGRQEKTFIGWLDLHFFIPYSQKFFEDTKRGLQGALESYKKLPNKEADQLHQATELEARIRDLDFNKFSYLELCLKRELMIKKDVGRSGRPSYNIYFRELDVHMPYPFEGGLISTFKNKLIFKEKQDWEYSTTVNFDILKLDKKNDMEEVNSLLDEYFETPRPNATNSSPDITKSSHRKRLLIILLVLFSFLAITIFSLGYYNRNKVKKCSNYVYKKRQGRKKMKVCQ